MLICFIILIALICILGYKIYKLEKLIEEMQKDMDKFKKSETTKREIGWDSVWKIINGRST